LSSIASTLSTNASLKLILSKAIIGKFLGAILESKVLRFESVRLLDL
jgi:hypothetical protein